MSSSWAGTLASTLLVAGGERVVDARHQVDHLLLISVRSGRQYQLSARHHVCDVVGQQTASGGVSTGLPSPQCATSRRRAAATSSFVA